MLLLWKMLVWASRGALAGALVWALLRVSGCLARHDDWVLSAVECAVFAGVSAAVAGCKGGRGAYAEERTARSLAASAEGMGLRFTPGAASRAALPHLDALPVVREARSLSNHMTGRIESGLVEVMDVFTPVTNTDSEGSRSEGLLGRTVVVFVGVGGLPDIRIEPLNVGTRLLRPLLGGGEVTFAAAGAGADEELVRQMHSNYRLRPGAEAWDGEGSLRLRPEAERALAELFTADVVRLFAIERGWSVQSAGGLLAVWREDRVLTGDERRDLVRDAARLRDVLARPAAWPVLQVIATPPESQAVTVRRFLGMLACGVVGAIAGVAVGFLVSPPLVNAGHPFAAFLLTGALMVAGLALGATAGLRWPVPSRLPNDPRG